FFFSSRRRHTRFSRDWSSDVCSSDLRKYRAAQIAPTWSSVWVSGAGVGDSTSGGSGASEVGCSEVGSSVVGSAGVVGSAVGPSPDRKSTRLNSSHVKISYAVCCLKKK